MKVINTEDRKVDVITDRICNKCGQSLWCGDNFNGLQGWAEGAYDSPCLEDGAWYEFDVCEPCLFEYMQTFKIKPDKSGGLLEDFCIE